MPNNILKNPVIKGIQKAMASNPIGSKAASEAKWAKNVEEWESDDKSIRSTSTDPTPPKKRTKKSKKRTAQSRRVS